MQANEEDINLIMVHQPQNKEEGQGRGSYSADYIAVLTYLTKAVNGGYTLSNQDMNALEQRAQSLIEEIKTNKAPSEQDLLSFVGLSALMKGYGSKLDMSEYQIILDKFTLNPESKQNFPRVKRLMDRINATWSEVSRFELIADRTCDYFLPTFINDPLADATLRFYIQKLPLRFRSRAVTPPSATESSAYKVESIDHNGWTFAFFGFPNKEGFKDLRVEMIQRAKAEIDEAVAQKLDVAI